MRRVLAPRRATIDYALIHLHFDSHPALAVTVLGRAHAQVVPALFTIFALHICNTACRIECYVSTYQADQIILPSFMRVL